MEAALTEMEGVESEPRAEASRMLALQEAYLACPDAADCCDLCGENGAQFSSTTFWIPSIVHDMINYAAGCFSLLLHCKPCGIADRGAAIRCPCHAAKSGKLTSCMHHFRSPFEVQAIGAASAQGFLWASCRFCSPPHQLQMSRMWHVTGAIDLVPCLII